MFSACSMIILILQLHLILIIGELRIINQPIIDRADLTLSSSFVILGLSIKSQSLTRVPDRHVVVKLTDIDHERERESLAPEMVHQIICRSLTQQVCYETSRTVRRRTIVCPIVRAALLEPKQYRDSRETSWQFTLPKLCAIN